MEVPSIALKGSKSYVKRGTSQLCGNQELYILSLKLKTTVNGRMIPSPCNLGYRISHSSLSHARILTSLSARYRDGFSAPSQVSQKHDQLEGP